MSIAEELAAASVRTVEAGGLHWQIRKISTAEMYQNGVGGLLATLPTTALQGGKAGQGIDEEALSAAILADPKKTGEAIALSEAVVAAGVVATRRAADAPWEPLRVTCDLRQANPARNVLHVSQLPPGAATALSKAIQELSGLGGDATKQLGTFPGKRAPRARRGK